MLVVCNRDQSGKITLVKVTYAGLVKALLKDEFKCFPNRYDTNNHRKLGQHESVISLNQNLIGTFF